MNNKELQGKLDKLKHQFAMYWDTETIEVDIANAIVNQVPSLISTIEEQQKELERLKDLDEWWREYSTDYEWHKKENEQLRNQLQTAVEALKLYADDDFYNHVTDDATDNAKEALSHIQGKT